MFAIEFEDNRFLLETAEEFVSSKVKDHDAGSHVYGRYGLDLLRNLYVAQNRSRAISATILFEPSDTDKLLKHINIFNTFSFTLVPTRVEMDIYKQIYEFFMYSPLSVTYITWISSLMLKPARAIQNMRIDGNEIRFPVCTEQECFLANRNCSKGLIFQQLLHPDRGLPSEDDMQSLCGIQRHFSELIAKDLSAAPLESIETVDAGSNGPGSRRHYWMDPFNIYAGVPLAQGPSQAD